MTAVSDLQQLAASLGIGLLVGIERGWHQRSAAPGTRVAGVRTFALVGLLGGLSTRIGRELDSAVVPGIAFAVLGALLVAAYAARVLRGGAQGATTEIATLVTFVLGAGPPLGFGLAATAAAVVVAALLSTKGRLHALVEGIEQRELFAALQLLALAFLLLPFLPEKGLGPWQALHLRSILLLVLLIGGLSFVGYAAIKRTGARLGLGLSALLGGLVSSTAVTVEFSHRAKHAPSLRHLLSAGVVGAGGTMFARMVALVAIVQPALLPRVAPALGVGALICWSIAILTWRQARDTPAGAAANPRMPVRNPLSLRIAFQFAGLLALVSVLAAALRDWMGDRGVYLLAVVAGLGDVDAITLALSRQHGQGLAASVAGHGILIAASVDTLLKTVLARVLGGRDMGRAVAKGYLLALGAGAVAFVVPWLLWGV